MEKEYSMIHSWQELEALVEGCGFLPFFRGEIPGFSVEEHTPPEYWFSPVQEGPWEWKGPVARRGRCLYGKFFGKKAGFISREWFPEFANYRRDGYDFDARYEDGLASQRDKYLYDTVAEQGSVLSKELKDLCNYRKGGNKGFDTIITRLQMETYLVIGDFEYSRDRQGRPYGWGVARYTTPEHLLGADLMARAYRHQPGQSRELVLELLARRLPYASREQLENIIR